MLRSRFLAIAVLAAVSSAPVRAEEPKSAPAKEASADGETKVAAADPKASSSSASTAEQSVAETPKAVPAKPAPLPTPTLTVQIDLAAQSMTVYEKGSPVHSWPISSGTASHPTPRGTFRPQWTAKMWYSRKYDNAPIPNAVFINGGVAIHATPYISRLGSPASHGCIRLAPGNAKIFYAMVHRHGLQKVRVSVHGTPNYGAYASAKSSQRYAAQQPATSSDDGWSWFFGPKQYAPTSSYSPKYTSKSAGATRLYVDKRTKRVYYKNGGKRIYVQQAPKPKYSLFSSNTSY